MVHCSNNLIPHDHPRCSRVEVRVKMGQDRPELQGGSCFYRLVSVLPLSYGTPNLNCEFKGAHVLL